MKLEIQNDLYPFRDSWIGQLLMVTHEFDIEKDETSNKLINRSI